MPTSYIPYRLVHAHRSASRSTAADDRSLDAPTDRSLPQDSELDGPLHPQHAVSTTREPTTGLLARVVNNGYTLELSNLALSTERNQASSSSSTHLNINFSDRLRTLSDGCIVPYTEDGRVYILLLTQTDVLYRLKLSLTTINGRSIVSTKSLDDWYEEWEVPEDTLTACGGIGAWTVIDEDTLILGGGDGGIVRLTRSGKWGRGTSHIHDTRGGELIDRRTMVR
jgi:nuclear pore complex protein Nup160